MKNRKKKKNKKRIDPFKRTYSELLLERLRWQQKRFAYIAKRLTILQKNCKEKNCCTVEREIEFLIIFSTNLSKDKINKFF